MCRRTLKGLDNLVLPSYTDCYLGYRGLKGLQYTRILYLIKQGTIRQLMITLM